MRRQAGFTLLELLLAAALLSLLLTVLAALFASSVRAYRVSEQLAERQQNHELAQQLLQYELSLAGYRGTDATAASRGFSDPMLAVAASGSSDTITVRYYEDRMPGTTTQQTVTFSVDTSSKVLRRRVNSGSSQPAVEGVAALKVLRYMNRTGVATTCLATCPAPPSGTVGMSLLLTFAEGRQQEVAIVFANPLP